MQYTYTATKDTYYHATGSFTAKDGPLPKVTVQTGDWLTELALSKDNLTSSKGNIPLDQTFDPASHAYTAAVADTPAAVYLCINGDIQTGSTAFLAQYRTITNTAQDDQLLETQITSAQLGTPVFLRNLLLNQNGRGNTLTIRCQRTAGSVTYYQEYIVTLRRTLSLRDFHLPAPGRRRRSRTAAARAILLRCGTIPSPCPRLHRRFPSAQRSILRMPPATAITEAPAIASGWTDRS